MAEEVAQGKCYEPDSARAQLICTFIQAATFGRAFLDLYNPTDLVNMAQTLRVLNAVRDFEIGIPLTFQQ